MKRLSLILLLLCLHTISFTADAAPWDLDPLFGSAGKVLSSPDGSDRMDGRGIALLPNGKIIAVSEAIGSSPPRGFLISRFNADGTLDTAFGTNGIATVAFSAENTWERAVAVAIQADGKIVVGGYVGKSIQTIAKNEFAVARLDPDGTIDNSFDTDGRATISFEGHVGSMVSVYVGDLEIASDGKIVLSGEAYDQGFFVRRAVLARLNSDGSIDNSFDTDGRLAPGRFITPIDMIVLSDNTIVLAGYSYAGFDYSYRIAVKYNASGTEAWENSSIVMCFTCENFYGVAAQPDGKLLLAGKRFGKIGLFRLNADGSSDPAFGANLQTPSGQGYNVAIQPDGKIVMNAQIGTAQSNTSNFSLLRFNSDGTADTAFGLGGLVETHVTAGTDFARELIVQPDGKILLGGSSALSSPSRYYISMVRYMGGEPAQPHDALIDFDGDRKTDISIFRPSDGNWWWIRSIDGAGRAAPFSSPSAVLTPADFTGDGKTDTAYFATDNTWNIVRSENFTYYAFPFGAAGDVPAQADYDGDGKADAAVFRPSNSTWFVRRSSDNGTTIRQFGAAGDRPTPSDYDGDGKTDIAIYRPGSGQWWIDRTTAGLVVENFGAASDRTVQGDYSGDGRSDVAVFRPSTGEWFILRSEDSSYYSFPFGTATDLPAPGDYDGDGKQDAAVFRPSDTNWYVQRSTAGILVRQFGAPTDVPVPGLYVR